ncbi:PREDICTED: ribokinase-like [Amphimedon queenslandica]|uniref:Ribokinase n=1 Tax=Amphimedon queenslandica TaxID=400682 RepID=A0A1X7TRV8_AMPQE|nr:PREDICTED: ribokinase-like [Amphimedon queenslandica]|eukprot:XP_011406960.1 PREDICTED: ribokinase-like [Amphimedon queenslandica]
MAEVVVAGSCMIDLICYVSRLPKPGETIAGRSFSQGFGGKGANQCIMAARLGSSTAMVAKLGNDSFGRSTIENFNTNKVNVDHVGIVDESQSGVAQITVNDEGENSIVIVSGANNHLNDEDLGSAKEMISRAKVLVCQLEISPETTLNALKLAKEAREDSAATTTIFNAAPGLAGLKKEFYKYSDILCVNETEAELLSGVSVTDRASGESAVLSLQNEGPGCVVLTMGSGGVLYTLPREERNGDDSVSVHHIPAEPVNVVDTTGAGDAFVGALAYYIARHSSLSFSEKIRRSSLIATHTVTLPGTQTSFQTHTLPKELMVS